MRTVDTGYQYDPLIIRFDVSQDKGVFLENNLLSDAQLQYTLICVGSASRFPVWQHKTTGKYIGGIYANINSQLTLLSLYQAFKREVQVLGYSDALNGSRSKNPFSSVLYDGLPRHVWAYAYEKGRRACREERRLGTEILPVILPN